VSTAHPQVAVRASKHDKEPLNVQQMRVRRFWLVICCLIFFFVFQGERVASSARGGRGCRGGAQKCCSRVFSCVSCGAACKGWALFFMVCSHVVSKVRNKGKPKAREQLVEASDRVAKGDTSFSCVFLVLKGKKISS
jgi:hypothetical protein